MVREKEINAPEIFLVFSIVILAVIVFYVSRLPELLVYDRRAILNGEIWRLLTAPVVHFSASHLFWDTAVFGAAGLAINISGFRGLWKVCVLGTLIPGVLYLLSLPDLEHYGGLSGLATGAVAYYCLRKVRHSRNRGIVWMVILAGTGIKIVAEAATGAPIFAQVQSIPYRVLPSAHLAGFLGAMATVFWPRCQKPKT